MNLLSILRPGNDINPGIHTPFHMSTENLDIWEVSVVQIDNTIQITSELRSFYEYYHMTRKIKMQYIPTDYVIVWDKQGFILCTKILLNTSQTKISLNNAW